MFMGPLNPKWATLQDIRGRELVAVVPLAVLMLILGLFPSVALGMMTATLTQMAAIFK